MLRAVYKGTCALRCSHFCGGTCRGLVISGPLEKELGWGLSGVLLDTKMPYLVLRCDHLGWRSVSQGPQGGS